MQSLEAQDDPKDVDGILAKLNGMTRGQWKYVLILSILQLYVPIHMMFYFFVSKEIPFTCDENFEKRSATLDSHCDSCLNKTFSTNESSIVSEWNLTCERAWLSPATMSCFMLGAVFGTIFLGWISDSHGRKSTIFFTLLFMITANVLGAVTNRFDIYCVSRVISGSFCGGCALSIYVLTNEIISNKNRGAVSFVTSTIRSLGLVLLPLLAYFIPHWRFFTMMTSLMGVPILLMVFVLPESPIWLQTKGRTEDATKALQAILSGDRLNFQLKDVNKRNKSSECGRVCDLFSTCSSSVMTLIVIYCWFVNYVAHYALFAVAGIESQDMYLSGALSGIFEVLGSILGPGFLIYFGRRASFSGLLLIYGLSLFIVPLFDSMKPVLKMLIANFGFFCTVSGIEIGHIHTNELFPTYIRNTGMGIVGMFGRSGGIVAPYFAKLGIIYPNLQFIVLGFLALSAGIASLNLPETEGQKLPETMADLLKMLRKQRIKKDKIANYHLLTDE